MPTYKIELIQQIRAYAEDHYTDGGWDVLVECWSDDDIAQCFGRSWTFTGALTKVAAIMSIYADRQADAINSAF